MNFRQRLVAVTLVSAATFSAAGQTGDKPAVAPAKWAPENALAFVGVSDVTQLISEFKQTAYYRMTQDPSAKNISGQMSLPLKMFEQFKKRLATALDTEPDRLRNPFGGPLALFVAPPAGDLKGDIQIVLAAGIGDAAVMRDYYDKATRKLREVADNHEKVSFKSYTIDYFTSETKEESEETDEATDPNTMDFEDFGGSDEQLAAMMDEMFGSIFSSEAMPEKLALCLTDDRLIAGPNPDAVKDVLRRDGSAPSLADTDTYKTMLREFKPLGATRFLVNLSGIYDLIEAVEGDEARDALKLMGARSATAVIGHGLYGGGEFESKGEALVLMSGARTGLAKIFSMENSPVKLPDSVSADNFLYVGVNLDVLAIIDEVERMVRMDDPAQADEMHKDLESIELAEGESVNLRTEVLANLRPPLTFNMGFQKPYGPDSTRMLLTLGHRDKDALAGFLEKMSNAWVGMLIDREVQGAVVYDAAFGGVSLAVTDSAVLAGVTAALESTLRSPSAENSLSNTADFKTAAALAPKEAWATIYVDSKKMYEAALAMARDKDALRAAQFTNPASIIALQIVEALTMGIEEGDLDAARRLMKYQAPAILTVATTPEGIRLTQIQLKAAD